MLGAGGGGGSPFGPAPFLLGGGGVGAAKSLLPSFLVPKGNQPTACTLALWWLKFGPTEGLGGGGAGSGGGGEGGLPRKGGGGQASYPDKYGIRPPHHYITPAFSGIPKNMGDKIRIGGAHKWAEMLHHPCILGDPQQRGQSQSKKKQKKQKQKFSHGVPGPAYSPAD